MIALPQFDYISPEEYLEMEEQSKIKHEYIDGEVYAMAGASDAHVTISLNIAILLRNHLRGSGCRVYMADMKVRIESLRRFYYPDVMVTCDPKDTETDHYKQFPKLIIEVLSKSTEAFDRGDKFSDYQQIESLQEYLLIHPQRFQIDCFRRDSQGFWVLQTYRHPETPLQLTSLNFEGNLTDIYEEVHFGGLNTST